MKKSVRIHSLLPSTRYEQRRDVSHRCTGAEVHFRISRQYAIRLHQPGQSAGMQRISAAQRDETRCFIFLSLPPPFFINRVENLTEAASKKHEGGRRWIKWRYVRVDRNREVETGSRQRYVLSPPLFLPFSRESQFSLRPAGHGSIAVGETNRR